jgi:hypothetical protein
MPSTLEKQNMNNATKGGVHQTLEGYYRVAVVDGQTNEVIWEQPELKKNLILNQGMDAVFSTYYAELMRFAVAGTGTRPNFVDPAGSVMSQTSTTIYLNPTGSGTGLNSVTESFGGYSSAISVGDIIKYATGSGGVTEVTVTAVENLTASVSTALSITSQSFTVWKTSQTGLQTEIKRAGGIASSGDLITGTSYLVGTGNCGTSSVTGEYTLYRTYDFQTESISRTYGEIGVAWLGTTGSATVFSRVVLPSTVFVDVGQRLRVFYQLNLGLSPASGSPRPNVSVTGWPVSPSTNTNGTESIQKVLMSGISITTGDSITSATALEPNAQSSDCQFWISNESSSLQAWDTAVSRIGTNPTAALANPSKAAYTNGSYICDKTATFTANSWNGSNIRSMGFGDGSPSSPVGATTQAFCFLFEQSQSKANTQTLTLTYRWTWGRILSN